LGLIAAVPALSTDMYLAAMPLIASQWGISESRVGQSMVLWFVSFSIMLLVCGPLSDKYGRRPVLLTGLSFFTVSSFLCSSAGNIVQLILFRMLQGASAAAPASMCMAICRDRYEGEQRKHVLAYISIILSITPMIAPMIGAMLLKYVHWRAIFIVQGVLTVGTFIISLSYRETLQMPLTDQVFKLMGRYINLLRNTNYLLCNNAMGILAGPFYGYLAFSSIVYISLFRQSEQTFSILFGINAMISMLGAFTCTRITRYFSDIRLITCSLFVYALCGLGMMLWGHVHFLLFAVFMAGISFCLGMSRPLSNHLILEQVKTDIGSASSFIVFYQFLVGSVCMAITTMVWTRPIFIFGVLAFTVPVFVLMLWPLLIARIYPAKQSA
jgi:DHA1 family bicyclomycin/chloramphenicol resistance-like MFS transporter